MAPLNLALPGTMGDMPEPDRVTAGDRSPLCPSPGDPDGDHGSHHDHACFCLFCTAFGGPSLAGANLELAGNAIPLAASTPFDLSDTKRLAGHAPRLQYCRGPPAAA